MLQQKKPRIKAVQSTISSMFEKYEKAHPFAASRHDNRGEKLTETETFIKAMFSELTDAGNYRMQSLALRDLLTVAFKETEFFDNLRRYGLPMARLAKEQYRWLKPVKFWKPKTHNTDRQFSSLIRHLLCLYDVPSFMDNAWFGFTETNSYRETASRYREWFIHIGTGNNIRKAEGLPIPLTKKQAMHFLDAPADSAIPQALRYGQILGLGGTSRLAASISETLLRDFHTYAEPFWETVILWFIGQPMFDYNQIGPIIDFLNNQRFVRQVGGDILQPNLSMKGRTINSVMAQMEVWHGILRKRRNAKNLIWGSCAIKEFDRMEGADEHHQKRYQIKELLSSKELQTEGNAMHHCVYSYAHSCFDRRIAIFSLTKNGERSVTIEINLSTKTIVQVRGKRNKTAEPTDERIIRAWATQEDLRLGSRSM